MTETTPEPASEPDTEPEETPEEDGGPERIVSDPREAAGVPLEAESSNLTEPDTI